MDLFSSWMTHKALIRGLLGHSILNVHPHHAEVRCDKIPGLSVSSELADMVSKGRIHKALPQSFSI